MPPRCTVCGDLLPSSDFPDAKTCREWADRTAAKLGDMLTEADYRDLMLMRGLCQWDAALRDGREVMGEP